jgi:GntR family colanic acid and biofilm gene transcriptional regulator
MSFRAAKALTLQESVYEQILNAILSGSLPGGERITTKQLADQMSVSVQPVREAIVRLQDLNLVTVENRRITVTEKTLENMGEFTELRLTIEGFAVEKACRRRSAAALRCMESLLSEMKREGISTEDYLKANRDFHRCIYAEAGIPQLEKIIDFMWVHVAHYLRVLRPNETELSVPIHFHEELLEAVRQRDAEAARKWLAKDLMTSVELITKARSRAKGTPADPA